MKQDVVMRELGWTIKRVSSIVPQDRPVNKSEFERMLDEIIMCIHRNRNLSIDSLAAKTEKVLADMPSEYGLLSEKDRTLEHLVGYLYGKYLKELGQL